MSKEHKNDENMEKTMTFDKEKVTSQTNETKVAEKPKDSSVSRTDRRRLSKEARKEKQEVMQKEELEEGKSQRRMDKAKKRSLKVRVFPIWLRLIIIVIFCAVSLAAGAMIGYGVIGNGKPMDVFHKQTWQHIYNIIYEKK